MQQLADSAPSPESNTFAGLLATLASTAHRPGVDTDGSLSELWKKPGVPGDESSSPARKHSPVWNDDELEDDITTLSYERALRTHARYRAVDPVDRPPPLDFYELASEEMPLEQAASPASSSRGLAANSPGKFNQEANTKARPATTCHPPALFERNLKNSSITIRMSKEECAQLHRRADEAGLTVSAYLRSCTFEAESLRALVKDTMAQLKSATDAGKPIAPAPARSSWAGWLKRFFTPWQGTPRTARA